MDFYLFMLWMLGLITVLILISSLDELFLDLVYFFFFFSHKYKFWKHGYKPLTIETISDIPEQKIAIMVACWNEYLVIEDMLKHNVPAINYKNYTIFVGVYPNDALTIEAVERARDFYNNIIPVPTKDPGPSTKAANLNNVYHHILSLDKETQDPYEIFVFHDAEDVIHPLSLKLYNYLIPRKDMVQIPVFPLEVNLSLSTHWTYNDEFAENHTRTMIAREIIGGLVPSAGVGTGFSRKAIQLLASQTGGSPFNVKSFTEDYHVSLKIRLLNLKSIFLTQKIVRTQTKKRWIFFGKLVPKNTYELVATRSLFPTQYLAAVRQKARWIMGITLQEWQQGGWPGNWAIRYSLFHDRKALFTHCVNFFAYIVFGYWIVYYFLNVKPSFFTLIKIHPSIYYLVMACTAMMAFRISQRAWATYRIYGGLAAILSIPRTVYGNVINFHSLMRAYRCFFFTPKKDSKWDKTKNAFPTKSTLKKYTKKLGDLLLEGKIITSAQLQGAIHLQKTSQQKLGEILMAQYAIPKERIVEVLAKQFNMEILDKNAFKVLKKEEIDFIKEDDYNWLIANEIYPISFYKNVILLALEDPTNEARNKEAMARLIPHEVKFFLFSK